MGCPLMGSLLLGLFCCSLRGGAARPRGPPPLETGTSSLLLNAFWRWFFALQSQKEKKNGFLLLSIKESNLDFLTCNSKIAFF